jgi:hypothetical protein
MPFDIFLSYCPTYSALEKNINNDVKKAPSKKIKAMKKKLHTLKMFQDIISSAGSIAIAQSETSYWIFDIKENDPWMVFQFLPIQLPIAEDDEEKEDKKKLAATTTNPPPEKTYGYYVFSLSITAPRFVRNLMNALQFALQLAKKNEGCTVLVKDPIFLKYNYNSELLTEESLRENILGGNQSFLNEHKVAWMEKILFMSKKVRTDYKLK